MDIDTAADLLSRLRGPGELRAAVLALLLPDSQRAGRAWEIETTGIATAVRLREAAAALPRAARLPWIEKLLDTMLGQPPAARQELLESTRRVMVARGGISPLDRLHWLAMRQRLGPRPAYGSGAADAEVSHLPDAAVLAAAAFCGHLARLVPSADESAGRAWFDAVTAPWKVRLLFDAMPAPDGDALVHALATLQALGWTQRPVLVRGWVDAAVPLSLHRRLGDDAADALRLASTLLDTPMPPALERRYAVVAGLPR